MNVGNVKRAQGLQASGQYGNIWEFVGGTPNPATWTGSDLAAMTERNVQLSPKDAFVTGRVIAC